MGRLQKFFFNFSWLILIGQLMACVGGTPASGDGPANSNPQASQGVGAGVGETKPAGQNQAAPYQVSGSGSENYDPSEGDRTILYRIKLADDPENLTPDESGGFLFKGLIQKKWPDSPDLPGRTLRIIDARYKAFIDLPLGQGKPEAVPFETTLKFEPVSEEALTEFGKEAFHFQVSPDGFDQAQAVLEIQACPPEGCQRKEWHNTDLVTPYTPLPPPAANSGKPPPGTLHLPGKK